MKQAQRSLSENLSDGQIINSCCDNDLILASQMTEAQLKSRKSGDKKSQSCWDPVRGNVSASLNVPAKKELSNTLDIKNVKVNFAQDWYVPPPKKVGISVRTVSANCDDDDDDDNDLLEKVHFSSSRNSTPVNNANEVPRNSDDNILLQKVNFKSTGSVHVSNKVSDDSDDDDDDDDSLLGKICFSSSTKVGATKKCLTRCDTANI